MTVELHLGDCIPFMKGLADKSIDCVLTDPPYGINGTYETYDDSVINLAKLVPAFMSECKRIADRVVVFTGVKHTELYQGADWRLCWARPAGTGIGPWGFTCWTPIAVFGKDPYLGKGSRPDLYVDYRGRREKDIDHPYVKPMSVMLWLMERTTNPNDTVFDPFMGSGTTGVACVQTGRNFIGCEIDEGYFKIAEKRIAEAQLQMRMEI